MYIKLFSNNKKMIYIIISSNNKRSDTHTLTAHKLMTKIYLESSSHIILSITPAFNIIN